MAKSISEAGVAAELELALDLPHVCANQLVAAPA